MKFQIPFSDKNLKNINLSSAKFAQRVERVNILTTLLNYRIKYRRTFVTLCSNSTNDKLIVFNNIGFDIPCKLSTEEKICMIMTKPIF